MVGNQTNGNILRLICLIFCMSELTDLVPERSHGIHIENGIYVLHHAGQTLQTHSRINIFLLQLGIVIVAVVLKLGKYVVPDFHITVAVASHGTAGLSAAILFSSVIVNL